MDTGFGTQFGEAVKRATVAMLIRRGDNIDPDRLATALKAAVVANYDQLRQEWRDAGEVGSDCLAQNLLNIQANWIAAKAIQEYDTL